MSDEGFREIQLNGKQLVFLFMAATVVLVVTFLLGVMTGRSSPGAVAVMDTASGDVSPDPGPPPAADVTSAPPSARPNSSGAPAVETPRPADELTYADRLLRDGQPAETLKTAKPATSPVKPPPPPAPAKPVPAPAAAPPPSTPPVTPPPASRAAGVASVDPSGPGFAVQVAISKNRREADTLAKELVAKGYPAFVMDPAKGAPAGIYRVRIGKYKTRKDAEDVAARLKTVEQFDPWIAR